MSRTHKKAPPNPHRKERKKHRRRVGREDRRMITRQTKKLEALPEIWEDTAPRVRRHTEGWETW